MFDEGFYLVGRAGLVIDVDYSTWGWTHIVIGTVGVLAGLGLLAGTRQPASSVSWWRS